MRMQRPEATWNAFGSSLGLANGPTYHSKPVLPWPGGQPGQYFPNVSPKLDANVYADVRRLPHRPGAHRAAHQAHTAVDVAPIERTHRIRGAAQGGDVPERRVVQ